MEIIYSVWYLFGFVIFKKLQKNCETQKNKEKSKKLQTHKKWN